MKILLCSIDYRRNKGEAHELFRDEIVNQHNVVRVVGFRPQTIGGIVEREQPDLVMVHHLQFSQQWFGLAELSIPTACYCIDFFPRHTEHKASLLKSHQFDWLFLSQSSFVRAVRLEQQAGTVPTKTKPIFLPFSVSYERYFTSTIRPHAHRNIDVAFIASDHPFEYPQRASVYSLLRRMNLNSCLSLLSNPRGLENPGGGIYRERYAETLKSSKIFVASNDQHGSLNLKHLEAMASGCLLITNEPHDFVRVGFTAGTHYVRYTDINEIPDLVSYYLKNDNDRIQIARAGQELVQEKHTTAVRVRQMFDAMFPAAK